MAEIDPTEQVTIRNKDTHEERVVPRGALAFHVKDDNGFEVVDSKGRVSGSATAAAKKEN